MLGPPAGLAQERYVQRGAIAIAASAVPTRKGRYSTTSERFPPVEAKRFNRIAALAVYDSGQYSSRLRGQSFQPWLPVKMR